MRTTDPSPAPLQRPLTAKGGNIVTDLSYVTGQSDFADPLAGLVAMRPDVLFLPNYEEDVAQQLQGVRSSGLEVTVLGSDGWNPQALRSETEIDGEAHVAQVWHTALLDDVEGRDLATQYLAAAGRPLTGSGVLAHDSLLLLAHAKERSSAPGKALQPSRIRDDLAATHDFDGLTGTFGFRGRQGNPLKPLVVLRVRNGETSFWSAPSPSAAGQPGGRIPQPPIQAPTP